MSNNPESLVLRNVSGHCGALQHALDSLDADLLAYAGMTLHNVELRDVLVTQVSVVREEVTRLHEEVKRALVLRLEFNPDYKL